MNRISRTLLFTFFIALIIAFGSSFLFTKISKKVHLSFSILIEEKSLPSQREFKASENNLGIVMIKFTKPEKETDKVTFRIKEQGEDSWFYENQYDSRHFPNNEFYPFGFPAVANSKGKIYQFELIPINRGSINISSNSKNFGLAYQSSKDQLISDISFASRFLYKKTIYAFNHLSLRVFLLASLVLTPLIWYAKYIRYFLKKRLRTFDKYIRSLKEFIAVREDKFKSISRNNKKVIFILSLLILFLTAFITRVAYYTTPENFYISMIAGLGGGGDYDFLIRFSNQFLSQDKTNFYFWQDDYPFLISIFAWFIKTFGFVSGLKNLTYSLILISSLTVLLPFLILSRKRYSVGGLIASLFFAVNPLSAKLATGYAVDTVTVFLFSLFIIFYLKALENKKLLWPVVLGIFVFLSGINRGIMMVSGFPMLVFFGLYYLFSRGKLINSWAFEKTKLNILKYSLLPLVIFLLLYFAWITLFKFTFGTPWFYAPERWLQNYDSITSRTAGLSPLEDFFRYINLFYLVILNTVRLSSLPVSILVLVPLALIIKFINSQKRNFILTLAIVILTIVTFAIIMPYTNVPLFVDQIIKLPVYKYLPQITLALPLFEISALLFIFIMIFVLKKDLIKYAIIIVPYIGLLVFGYKRGFYDRHFIQTLPVFFITLGLMLDISLKRFSFRKLGILNLVIILLLLNIFGFISFKVYGFSEDLYENNKYSKNEKNYLKFVGREIPSDGIILVGMNEENPTWISEQTQKRIVYNSKFINPVLVLPGKSYFHTPVSQIKDARDSEAFSLEKVLSNSTEFRKYKFYVLDYNIKEWNRVLSGETGTHTAIPYDKFKLEKKIEEKGRNIYQLVLTEGS